MKSLKSGIVYPQTISTPGICSGWLMNPMTSPSPSTTVIVGRRCDSLGSRSIRTWYPVELLVRAHHRRVGAHQRVRPGVPGVLALGEAAGDEVAVAERPEEAARAVVVHHRDDGDVAGLEHDRHFAGHRAGHRDVGIRDHRFRGFHVAQFAPNGVAVKCARRAASAARAAA